MIDFVILGGLILGVCLVAWLMLRPKQTSNVTKSRRGRADQPRRKRLSDVPTNHDVKIEKIGEARINTSDRRKR